MFGDMPDAVSKRENVDLLHPLSVDGRDRAQRSSQGGEFD
jgi:hypothetical protein